MAYLDDHPPRQTQFRPRGTTASGVIVVHTAESLPDFSGPDVGAEGVARFIQGRSDYGSYHFLCDSDSIVDLVRMSMAAYGDGTGSNSHAIHISAATQAARWSSLPDDWVRDTVRNMAQAAVWAERYVHSLYTSQEVWIPPRRITRAQSDARVEGFISHGERDPGRRSDPGASFPWDFFLKTYTDLRKPEPPPWEPTRGELVDKALRRTSGAITLLEKSKGSGQREQRLEQAEQELRQARRALRRVGIINLEGKPEK